MEPDYKLFNQVNGNIACGSAVYRKEGDKTILVTASPSVIKLAGYKDSISKKLKEFDVFYTVHPDDIENVQYSLKQAFVEEKNSECIFRYMNYYTHRYVWIYSTCMPVKQADGSIYAFCCFIDVTKQKNIERELLESKKLGQEAVLKLNRLYDEEIMKFSNCYDDCICVMRFNIHKNKIEWMEGRTLSGQIHPGMSVNECYKKAEFFFGGESGKGTFYNIFDSKRLVEMFNAGKRSKTLELPINIDEYTGTLWLRFTINMKKNPYTNDIIVFVIEEDITVEVLKREASKKLVYTEFLSVLCVDVVKNRYFCCFTVEPDMYMGRGKYGRNGDYNATMRRIFYNIPGVSKDKRDKSLENLDPNVIREKLADASEYVFYYDRTVKGIDKRYKISIRWLDKKNNIVVIAKKDVTETVREEQKKEKLLSDALYNAKKANEAKTVFLSNMSHDMRTPLNGVIGFTNLAIESNSLNEKNEYLEKIKTSGEFLVQLINDTLDLGKIESHKMTLNYEDVDWYELFKSVLNSVQTEADRKNITLIADTSKWYYTDKIYVDSLRLKQIFLNLLSNAIKFTPEGGKVQFVLECMDESVRDCNCRIIVCDNGSGMSEEFAKHAFEPYSQDETRAVTRIEGTGLGLSIAKNLVEMMGGFIELESEENIGTQFIVYLPVKKSEQTLKEDDSKKRNNREKLAGKNILLCEDYPVNIELLKLILKHAGINVICAEDGKEGLKAFKSSDLWHFDAILMDICMPHMDGMETTMAIRNLDREDAKKIPIIAMTANAYEEDKKKSFAAGMTAHLCKPIDVEQLLQTLEQQCLQTGDNTAEAYVDGSYYNGEFSYGVVILRDEKEICFSKKDNDTELAKMRNVAGEIKGAEAAMRYAVSEGLDKITIYHDYEGIAKWCLGEWKANKEGTKAYKRFYDSIKNQVLIEFVKVKGHSHDKYNDMADRLAKNALGL